MTDAVRSRALRDWKQTIEDLLCVLETPKRAVRSDGMTGVWKRCDEAFLVFRAEHERLGGVLDDETEGELNDVRRLHAVASSLAARFKEEAALEVARLAEARTRLETLRPERRSGGSCDLSG